MNESPVSKSSSDSKKDLKILAFCCRHCAYAAADLAGAMRLRYSPSVRIVEVPCTGRVEPLEMLHAFERGVDGLLVAG
mgnify:CR=1 FL=1